MTTSQDRVSNFSRHQRVSKLVVETRHGIVAAQHRRAAEVGAGVLAGGGNAVDAAVATSFALGVVEPWMSGPAGGGGLVLRHAGEGRAEALDFGMRSPAGLDPAAYPLSGAGRAHDLFPWEAVEGDRNVLGATAIAVPGLVDGMGRLHRRYGTRPWAELLQPAIDLAQEGPLLDWYASLLIASSTRDLARDPDAAALFLDDGHWPKISGWTALAQKRLDMSAMADTLRQIAEQGARCLYEGDLGERMVADVQAKGGCLSMDDLRAYRARFSAPLSVSRGGAQLDLLPGLTGGPSFRDAWAALEIGDPGEASPGPGAYQQYARALRSAYRRRLERMGHDGERHGAEGCTSHFSVVDRDGNMVSQTQTLLSIFGSRVVSPSTGLLMNNGIMWFDPVPGRPNSLAAGKPCLMNICPVIGHGAGARFAIGASGGRRILSAVVQLASFIADFGMDIGAAFHQPRIDLSDEKTVVADDSLPAEVLAALGRAHPLATAPRTVFPYAFACPAGVMRREDTNTGCTEIMSPWGDAIGAQEVI